MKKRFLAVAMVLAIFVCGIFVSAIADSGWDYDYDSGGSWGGSDWGYSGGSWGGSDWGYSGGSRHNSYQKQSKSSDNRSETNGGIGGGDIIAIVMFTVFIVVPSIIAVRNSKHTSNRKNRCLDFECIPTSISDEELEKYPDFNKEEFLKQAFDIYVGVQKAWSEFDYDTLRKLTTDEMYNMYKMQLETLELKNQKNVMTNFRKSVMGISGISKVNGILNVTVSLAVFQKDYVVDATTNEVIRGNANASVYVLYELTFVNNKGTDKVLTECPNCGAPIKDSSSQKCEYCNADLVGNATDNWVLAKKQNIRQGR